MNLKNFFIASLIIHIVGAIALYFYYNPITLAPKIVRVSKEKGEPSQQQTEKSMEIPKAKHSAFTGKERKKRGEKSSTKFKISDQNNLQAAAQIPKLKDEKTLKNQDILPTKKSSLKAHTLQKDLKKEKSSIQQSKLENQETSSTSTQEQALSEAKAPPAEIKEPFLKTADSPIELDLQEIKEGDKPLNPSEEKVSALNKELLDEDAQLEKDFEEVEETISQKPVEDSKKLKEQDVLEESPKIKDSPAQTTKTNEQNTNQDSQMETKNLTQKQNKKPSTKKEIVDFQDLAQKKGNIPLYPPAFARRAGMQGTVSVKFFVTQQGLVEKIQLLSSSGHTQLDNFALEMLSRYEFLPGQETWVRYDIPFVLKGEEVETLRLRHE